MSELSDLVLLANKYTLENKGEISNSWKFSEKIQSYLQNKTENHIPLEEVELTQFRDKEILPHVLENVRKRNVYYIHDSTLDP